MPSKHLFEHQELALGVMACTGWQGVYYDMGSGKTVIALMYLYEKLQKKAGMKALIICPAPIVDDWYAAVDGLKDFEGVTARGIAALKKAIYVTSYQKMYRTDKKPVTRKGRTYYSKTHPLRPEVDRHWDVLCIDEAHSIGAHNSVQSEAAWKIAKQSDERFLFTGTPVHGGGGKSDYSKLYGQARVLWPDSWITWTQFLATYVTRMNPRFHTIEAYNIPRCRALLEKMGIVCRLEDCVDMPGYVEVEVDCPLAEKQVYKDVKEMDVEKYGIDITTGGSPWIRLLQACSGSLKRKDAEPYLCRSSKDDKLFEILNGTEQKVVIFCAYTASVNRVAQICRKAGRKCVIKDGRSKGSTAQNAFQENRVDTIVCQYLSGGVGLNLQTAHIAIFFEPTPSALTYTQARRRVYRTGQTEKCVYYIFSTPRTVEAKAWESVREGLDVTDKMLEDWASEE